MGTRDVAGCDEIDGQSLLSVLTDQDRNVRLAAVLSLPPGVLGLAASDPDPVIRFAVAERISESELRPFLDDRESVIRELACNRLIQISERQVSRFMGENFSVMTIDPRKELLS